jgi:hypothetical protein
MISASIAMRHWSSVFVGVAALLAAASVAAAQDMSKTYTDSRGRKIVFRLGDASFADEVASFTIGKPAPSDLRWGQPKSAAARRHPAHRPHCAH